jgi:hypothetical protein
VHISYWTGIPAEALVRGYTLVICLAAVVMTGWIARAGKTMTDRALLPAMGLLFAISTILVGNVFAERDHIGAALVVPLVAMAAWRASATDARPQSRHWLAAGVAGGLLPLVKPYYAVVVLAAATYVVLRRRDVRLFILPEFLVAGAMSLTYVSMFYFAFPRYFEDVLPLLRETYLSFSWPIGALVGVAAPWLTLPLAYFMFGKRGGRSVLADLLLIAAAAAWLPFFLQGKGWAYHAYPAVYLGSAAIIVMIGNLLFDPAPSKTKRSRRLEISGFALLCVIVVHHRFLEGASPSSDLAAMVRAQTSSPTVGLLGGDIGAGHPLARMFNGRWIEPYCSDWIPVFALRLAAEAAERGDTESASRFNRLSNDYLESKRRRLTANPPDVLIVDERDTLVSLMLARNGYAPLLNDYARIGSEGELAVYGRLRSGRHSAGS